MNRINPFGTENFVIVSIIFLSKFLVPKFIPWCLCGNRASLSESGFTRLADEQDKPHSSHGAFAGIGPVCLNQDLQD